MMPSTVAAGAALAASAPSLARSGREAQGILFDLDGTVIDTYHLLLVSFRHTMETVLGRSIPDKVLMAKVGQPLNTQMWDFTDDDAVHEELCRTYRAYNEQVHDELIASFPGTKQALADLRDAGFPLGVVTSKRHAPALKGLRRFDLEDSFDFLIGSDDWPTHKPDPGPVEHGCDLMGLRPDEVVYVGDSPFDMQAGNSAGCMTVAALWGMFDADVLLAERPDFSCGSLAELPALLRDL